MVHRESIFPWNGQQTFRTLAEAKEEVNEGTYSDCIPLVIAVANGAGVQSVHCFAATQESVQKRLRIWSGCYGRWPVRTMKGSNEAKAVS